MDGELKLAAMALGAAVLVLSLLIAGAMVGESREFELRLACIEAGKQIINDSCVELAK